MRYVFSAALAGAAAILTGLASADTAVPHMKDGLWQSSMAVMGKPMTSQYCITEESQAKMQVFSSQMRQKNCSSKSISHNMDGSWSSSSTCTFGGKARTTHAHITGDFDSKITNVITTDGSSDMTMTMTMTWVGACKSGMKGGDVMMANGFKMNLLDGTMSGVPTPH